MSKKHGPEFDLGDKILEDGKFQNSKEFWMVIAEYGPNILWIAREKRGRIDIPVKGLTKYAIEVIEAMVEKLELEITKIMSGGVEKDLVITMKMPKIRLINHNMIPLRDYGPL